VHVVGNVLRRAVADAAFSSENRRISGARNHE
jgi:hypothetical protein